MTDEELIADLRADADWLEGVAEGNDDARIVGHLRDAADALTRSSLEAGKMREALKKARDRLAWIGNHGEVDDADDLDEQADGYGLDTDEFVRMAHDNLVIFARNAVREIDAALGAEGGK